MSSPFDEWFGRRRRFGSWFPDVDEMMRDVEKMMQEAFKNVEQQVPKNLIMALSFVRWALSCMDILSKSVQMASQW